MYKFILFYIGILCLFSCSGGGGAGARSDTSTNNSVDNITIDDSSSDSLTDSGDSDSTTDNAEYQAADFLTKLKFTAVYSDNMTGSGIKIALLNTGVQDLTDINNENYDKDGVIAVVNNASADSNAAIMVAEKNDIGLHGIAYNSEILDIQTHNLDPSNNIVSTVTEVEAGVISAKTHNVDLINVRSEVINGFDNISNKNSLITAIKASSAIIVTSVGDTDNGHTDPLDLAKLSLDDTSLTNMVVVAGVNEAGTEISTKSRYCGLIKNCLATYSENITTYDQNNNLVSMTGTDLSASIVTGVLALMKQKFSTIENDDLIKILLENSTPKFSDTEIGNSASRDAGDEGDTSDIYGYGLLDDAAILRIFSFDASSASTSAIAYSSSQSFSLENSYFSIDESLSSFAHNLSSILTEVQIFDKYKRNFNLDLSNMVSIQSSKLNLLNLFEKDKNLYHKFNSLGDKLTFTYPNKLNESNFKNLDFSLNSNSKNNLNFTYAQGNQAKFISSNDKTKIKFNEDPYMGLTDENLKRFSLNKNLGSNINLSSAIIEEGNNILTFSNNIFLSSKKVQSFFSFNQQRANNNLLGSSGSELLSLDNVSKTNYWGFGAKVNISKKLNFYSKYYQAMTEYDGDEVFYNQIALKSKSYAGELHYSFNRRNDLSLIYDVPFYIYKGEISANIPYGIDSNSKNILIKNYNLTFSDKASRNLKLIYNKDFNEKFTTSLMLQKGVDFDSEHNLIMTNLRHIF